MPVQMLRTALVFSALALLAASGRACDDDGGSDGGEEQATGNKVAFDANSPTAFVIGEVKASGTVTLGKGWTCTKVVLEAFDKNGVKQGTPAVQNNPGATWGPLKVTGLAPGMYTVKATGTFTSGGKTDTPPPATGILTVK